MSRPLLLLGAALASAAAGLAFWLLLPRTQTQPPPAPPPDVKPEWSAAVETQGVEVFQRAFWRRPSPEDRILHAERIQWSASAGGVRKWQWFLAVEPGPALLKWLRETNPFSLQQTTTYEAARDSGQTQRPAWFPATAGAPWEIQRGGTMTLLFDLKSNRLYATDAGHGFTRPAVSGTEDAAAVPDLSSGTTGNGRQ